MKQAHRSWAVRCAILALPLAVSIAPSPVRAGDLYLNDEREIYLALDKLNAMGRLPGFLANTRPYDVQAVRAAVDNVSVDSFGDPQSGDSFASWVAFYAKPTALVRGTASFSWAEHQAVPPISGGTSIPEGFSGEISALGRYEPLPWLSANAKGLAVWGEGGDTMSRLMESSIEFGHKYISLQAGKITTWYGPGRHGSLIFTNNAQPYPGVRLHNPVPIPITGLFSFLGSVQYDLFFAQLDEDRPVPDSMLSGMRIAARPSRYLEIGLSRAIHYGGEGHSDGLSAWWDAFKGTHDNDPGSSGNQIAGFDVEVTLPFKAQPVQLYLEMAGEDEAKCIGTPIPCPTKWATLGGIFLPAILGNPSFDIRFEYADNHRGGDGGSWYTHGSYPHEYKGQILGHPMGTDARDLWLQGHWFFLPSTYVELSWNRTDRYSLGPQTETTDRYAASFVGWLTKNVRTEAGFAWETVDNPGGVAGSETNTIFRLALSYQLELGR